MIRTLDLISCLVIMRRDWRGREGTHLHVHVHMYMYIYRCAHVLVVLKFELILHD